MTAELDTRRTSSTSAFGLLALRIGVGVAMIQAGLIKFLGFGTTVDFMETSGWRAPTFAAFMVSAAETVGGVGLLLGLLTPLAACAVLAAMIDAWAFIASNAAFYSDPFNVPFLAASGAIALLYTGAGWWSLDNKLWARPNWPSPIPTVLLVVAIVAAVVTWVALNGENPLHWTAPTQ
jgi:putative oxidoreductase